jgi:hypothetical protein
MPTEVEILGRVTTGAILEACRTVTLQYAQSVQGILLTDKPPPPAPGSMKFVSDRQRKFVMANIREGKIKVPYVRGRASSLKGAQSLSQSYRTNLDGDEAVLTSSASYANYVVGDQQAQIHQGRWTTARQAAEQMKQSGELQYIVDKVFAEVQ